MVFRQEAPQLSERENNPSANAARPNFLSRQHSVEGSDANAEHFCGFDAIDCQTLHTSSCKLSPAT
jgi:hypothetical protein